MLRQLPTLIGVGWAFTSTSATFYILATFFFFIQAAVQTVQGPPFYKQVIFKQHWHRSDIGIG